MQSVVTHSHGLVHPTPQVAFFFLFTVSTISVNYFLALIRDVYSQQYQHMIVHPERFKVEAEVSVAVHHSSLAFALTR